MSSRLLRIAFALTLGFAVVELLVGWWSGSLALMGDAGHMMSDALALVVAMLAVWFGQRPPSPRHSYGFLRAEVIAALLNGLFMLVVVIMIVGEAVRRLQAPQPVVGIAVVGVASLGLVVNIAVAMILSRGAGSLNVRAAMLHVMGDLLGSVAALIAGAVVMLTGWTPIDPLLSLAICGLILYSTLRLLREVLHVLMEGVPAELDLREVGLQLARVPGAMSVHDLHIWTVSSGLLALSAHVVVRDMTQWNTILAAMQTLLHERYGIDHVTLQPESPQTQTLHPVSTLPGGTGRRAQ